MDREGFRNRLKQYKEARGLNPLLKYWEWKQNYDSAPQPDEMPSTSQPDSQSNSSNQLSNRAHRWDESNTRINREPYDSPYEDARYYDCRKPRFELRKGNVHYANPNVLKWMGRIGKVMRGGSVLGEVVQNLFPSEEAESYSRLLLQMHNTNKALLDDSPKMYKDGGEVTGPPTEEEWNPRITAEGYDDKGYYAQAMNPLPEVTVVSSKTRSRSERPIQYSYVNGYPEATTWTTDYNPGAGALDIVSPEFDLFTLGRGLLTNLIKPKGKIGKLPTDKDKYYREVSDLFYGKSKNVGAINDIENSGVVRTDKYSGFKSPMFSKGKIYDGREGLKDSYYIVSNDKKGLTWTTVDALGVPNNNPKGIAFTPLYNGKYNVAPKDYFDIYKYLQDDLYLQIIPNHKVVPIAGLNAWSENIEGFADGGEVGDKKAVPTVDEYITEQINAKIAAAHSKSLTRTDPRVPVGQKIGERWNPLTKRVESMFAPAGPSCAYTFSDNYEQNWMSSEDFRQNHANYGWKLVPWEQRQPGDAVLIVDDSGTAIHTMMYDSDNAQGQPLFNHSNGGYDESAIRKKAKYIHYNPYLTYRYVGTPTDSVQWKNEYKKLYGYAEGGEVEGDFLKLFGNLVSYKPLETSWWSDIKNWWNDTTGMKNYAYGNCATTPSGKHTKECAHYSNSVLRGQGYKNIVGDAWTRAAHSGMKKIISGYDGLTKPAKWDEDDAHEYLLAAAKNFTNKVDTMSLNPYDVIGLYYPDSPNTKKAFELGKWGETQTHTGHIAIGKDGTHYVVHNVDGHLKMNKLADMITGDYEYLPVSAYRPKK